MKKLQQKGFWMGAILGMLANAGMGLLSSFIDKGKDEAVKIIKDKTGIDLSQKKELTPEDLQKLKEFEIKNKELILQKLQMYLADKQNAREMQMTALKQDDWFAKNFTNLFAAFWSIAAAVYIYFVTFTTFPQANQRFADTILGFLMGTIIASIIGFYYGSSLGSKEKTEILKEKNA